jgi:hypothetical protein
MNQYVMCIDNDGYPVSLDLLRVYQVVPDAKAESHEMVRIIDNSGEDYLFEADRFVPVELSKTAQSAFAAVQAAFAQEPAA